MVVKCLRTRLAERIDQLKVYKEAIRTFNREVNAQKDKVSQLEGAAYQVEELTKSNTNLTIEVAALRDQVDKVRANAMEEFKDSQPFFDLLGAQYGEGFEDYCQQVILLYPDLDFSFVQIDASIPMTPHGSDEVVDVEDDIDDAVEEAIVVLATDSQAPPGD